jgi:hypothetical protein
MVRAYWRRVHHHAWEEVLHALSLDTLDRAVFRIVGSVIGVALVWLATKNGTKADLEFRILGTTAILALFPVVYAWKFVVAPAKIDEAAQNTIAELNLRIDDRERRKKIQRQLGMFIESGQDILVQCHRTGHLPPHKEADQWETDVHKFLKENLDEVYFSRFRNWSDISKEKSDSNSEPHAELWQGMRARLARLHEYIAKLEAPGTA